MIPGCIIEVNIFMANCGFGNVIRINVFDEFDAVAGIDTEFGSNFPGAWGTTRITVIGSR